MKRRSREVYIYYGISIVICLLLIAGLVHILLAGNDSPEKKRTARHQAEEEKSEEPASVENANIRVLLKSTGFADAVHPLVQLTSEAGLCVRYGEEEEQLEANAVLEIAPDDSRFQKGNIRVEAAGQAGEITVQNLERGYGTPSYSGTIELRTTAEGVVMINELPLESYLCKVVPSEMPSSYELEALKAQAVCARSYAVRQMEDYGYPEYEAHVNDSTDYQVYGNSAPQDSTAQAVAETKGQVVWYNGSIVTTYFYSTSGGKTTNMEAWGTAPNDANGYLQSVNVCGDDGDYEKELPWYHWTATVSVQTLSNLVGLNTGTDVGTLSSVEVTKRGPGDVALQMTAVGDKGTVTVDTENKIRTALGGPGYSITKNDGSVVDSMELLPSAFISVEKSGNDFVISGGGFGHGIGMSQNGANEMAKQGKTYMDILGLFYPGVTVE